MSEYIPGELAYEGQGYDQYLEDKYKAANDEIFEEDEDE